MRLTAWPWSNCEQASFRAASLVGWMRLMWRWLTSQCSTHSDIAFLGRLMKLTLFFKAAPSKTDASEHWTLGCSKRTSAIPGVSFTTGSTTGSWPREQRSAKTAIMASAVDIALEGLKSQRHAWADQMCGPLSWVPRAVHRNPRCGRLRSVGAFGYTVDYVGARSSRCRILARVSIVSRCL